MRLLTLLCLLGGSLRATPALIAHTCSGSSTGSFAPSVTTLTTTGATFLIVVASDYNQTDSIRDSLSNTWTQFSQRIGPAEAVTLWYSANPTVGANQRFTVTGNYDATCVLAWTGVSGPDVTNPGSYMTGATVHPGSITPTANGDLLITGTSFDSYGSSDGAAVDNGFIISDTFVATAGDSVPCVVAWKIQTTAAAIDPTWSGTSSVSRTTIVAAFKAGAGGGSTRVVHRVTQQ